MKKISAFLLFFFSVSSAVFASDIKKHTIYVPDDITVSSGGKNWVIVAFDVSGVRPNGNPIGVVCSPRSGAKFPIGATEVNCRTRGDELKRDSGSFVVTVSGDRSVRKHAIQVPDDITVAAVGAEGAVVSYEVTGTRPNGNAIDTICVPESGSVFAIGSTQVDCRTKGKVIKRDYGSFAVTVVDDKAPTVAVPGIINLVSSDGGDVIASYEATAYDQIDGELAVQCLPASGAYFSVGSHTVTCSASDSAGNTEQQSFTVAVAQQDVAEVPEEPVTDPTVPDSDPAGELFSVTLNWTAPSTRANGSPLSLSEIAQYEIYLIGELSGVDQTFQVEGTAAQHTIEDLQGDSYHFAISTVDTNGLRSEPSEMVSVVVGN